VDTEDDRPARSAIAVTNLGRLAAAIALGVILTVAPACLFIDKRLPFYTQTNAKLPEGDVPVSVVHAPPPPDLPGLGQIEQKATAARLLDAPLVNVSALTALFPTDDPESRNARKLTYLSSGFKNDARAEILRRDPFPDVEVILALSGGGMRAANLSAGVMYELSRIPVRDSRGVEMSLLDTVDAISSVSGGSWTAAFYLYHRPLFANLLDKEDPSLDLELIQSALGENLERPIIESFLVPTKFSIFVRLTTHASRTDVYSNIIEYAIVRPQRLEKVQAQVLRSSWRGRPVLAFVVRGISSLFGIFTPINLHDQYLFGANARTFRDLYLEDASGRNLYPLRPGWLVNATIYNAPPGANNFVFDDATFARSGSDLSRYRVSDAVAASAAFPGAFAPATWRDWSAPKKRYLFLTDGGVSDNLGLTAAHKWMERRPRKRATLLISVDASPNAAWIDRTSPSRPGMLDVTNRAIGGYMSGVRRAALDAHIARSGRDGFSFALLSIRPEDQREWKPNPHELQVLQAANRIGTGLKISKDEQHTLFEAARILVGANREAILEVITGVGPDSTLQRASPSALRE
jgi:predicted acylesterase/phospholipase RssA